MIHGMGAGLGFFSLNFDKIVKDRTVYAIDLPGKLPQSIFFQELWPLFSSSYLFTRLYSRVYDLLLYNTQQTDQIT